MLESTLATLAVLLDRNGIRYMVIGGMANALWGEPRATIDIDVTVWVSDQEKERIVTLLTREFDSRVPEPINFIQKTRVLPLISKNGIPIDLIFGLLPYEEEAIDRAISRTIAETPVRFCTAEDLILHKIISTREQDLTDTGNIIKHQLDQLDLNYLEPRIRDLSDALERPEIWENWEHWKKA